MFSQNQVFTFSFPIIKIESAMYTDPVLLAEWLAMLLGESLIECPGSFTGTEFIKEDNHLYNLFCSTISPLDLIRIDDIFKELEAQYLTHWDDPVFNAFNFSDEGFHTYEYRTHDGHFSLIGYASPDHCAANSGV